MLRIASVLRRRPRLLMGSAMLGAIALVAGGTASVAHAVATQGYQISPPVTVLALNPGTSTKGTMKVTNLTSQEMTLTVTKQNFVAKGEEGQVQLVDNADPRYSLAPYFTLSTGQVNVPPDATSNLSYTISVPTDAEPGGRYGTIVFNTIPPPLPAGQSGAAVRQQLAGLILLRINGPVHEQLSIASFKTGKDFYEYGPVGFITRVQNEGNVHEKPTGQIVIKDMLGITTAKLPLDQQYVLPGAVRRLTNQLGRHLLFGRYTATVTVKNGTLQTLTAVTSFVVIPWKLLGLIILILIIIFLLYWKSRRRFGRAFRILAGRE